MEKEKLPKIKDAVPGRATGGKKKKNVELFLSKRGLAPPGRGGEETTGRSDQPEPKTSELHEVDSLRKKKKKSEKGGGKGNISSKRTTEKWPEPAPFGKRGRVTPRGDGVSRIRRGGVHFFLKENQ